MSTIYPLALLVAALVGLAFSTRWSKPHVSRNEVGVLIVSFLVLGGVSVALAGSRLVPIALLAAAGAAGVVLIRSLVVRKPRGRELAGHLAHLGLAMVLIGAGGSSLGEDFEGAMAPGDEVVVGGKEISLQGISTGEADRFIFVRADFDVNGAPAAPEIRAYEEQQVPVSEPELVTSPLGDVVVAISTVTADASVVNVSVFVRPMVWWVWAGALVLATAGLLDLAATGGAAAARRRSATRAQRSTGTTT